MRILFVTAAYLPDNVGGVELHVAGLARAMTAAGHECAVFTRSTRPEPEHLAVLRDEVDGVAVTRLGNTFEDATRFELMYDNPAITAAFARELARVGPDIVHVHHLTCLSVGLVDACKTAGVPVVMTLHDFWMGCPRGQRITAGLDLCPEIRLTKCMPCLRELWPHVLGRSAAPAAAAEERDALDLGRLEAYHGRVAAVLASLDMAFTPSAFMRRMYLDYGMPAASVAVVENGLPKAAWARALEAHGPRREAGRDGLRIGFVGSVIPSKGVHIVMEAFRRLGDPMGLRLDVWGEVLPFHHDTTYGERLQGLRKGYETAITLHGRYENEQLPQILAGLDVLVVPSLWYEAYGLTIREAFLAGLPVIAADHGAMSEAVRHEVNGLLFAAGDSEALAACLRRLADHPVLCRRLAGSPQDVRDEGEAADELLGHYDRVLSGSQPPGLGSPHSQPPGGETS